MSNTTADKIRNIAIIAHVDHGKTTLVDGLIRQTSSMRNIDTLGNLIMDSMDQEKERGITIKAKNASIYYDYKQDAAEKTTYKINIVDTPGHADFGGEVERALMMVDGAILLVDAQEGPMPQTRYVMKKAIAEGLKIIVVVNKVDKPAANPARALSKVEDLFLDLGASDDQMDFPVIYASGVNGKAGSAPDKLEDDLFYLLDKVVETSPPPTIVNEDITDINPLQILVVNLNYDSFKGKMGVGKITSGKITKGTEMIVKQENGDIKTKISSLLTFDGLGLKDADEVLAGEIVMVAGCDTVGIGDTITSVDFNKALPRVSVDEPTIRMTFGVNTSPFSGREGKFTTSRQLRERLKKELEINVALRVTDHPESNEKFVVSGRGELHLSVLIETMRREGFELEVSRPEVIYHADANGKKTEPYEMIEIDVPQEFQGPVMQELGRRGADIKYLGPNETGTEYHFEALMPTRTLLGLKSYLLTATKGTVVMYTSFDGYAPVSSAEMKNNHGSLVSLDTGTSTGYSLDNAQARGTLFIKAATDVYAGMVIGQSSRDEDLELNPCRDKKLTNIRSKSSDDGIALIPPRILSLEESLEYLGGDELLEVTPINYRIRKRYLDPNERRKHRQR